MSLALSWAATVAGVAATVGNLILMNKTDAARYLDIGVRSLERYTSANRLSADHVKTKTGQALDYKVEELDRFKIALEAERAPVVAANPATALARVASAIEVTNATTPTGDGLERFAALLGAAMQKHAPAAPVSEKPLLTMSECSTLTGYSVNKLKAAFDSDKLHGHRDGRIRRVRRVDLDAWLASL